MRRERLLQAQHLGQDERYYIRRRDARCGESIGSNNAPWRLTRSSVCTCQCAPTGKAQATPPRCALSLPRPCPLSGTLLLHLDLLLDCLLCTLSLAEKVYGSAATTTKA